MDYDEEDIDGDPLLGTTALAIVSTSTRITILVDNASFEEYTVYDREGIAGQPLLKITALAIVCNQLQL